MYLDAVQTFDALLNVLNDANTAISLNGSDVEMLNGDTVSISVEGDVLYINDSAVIVADISAANGIIHIIDTVLSPPES